MATFTNVDLDTNPNPEFEGGQPNSVVFVADTPATITLAGATFVNWDSGTDFVVVDGSSRTVALDITGSSESDHIDGGLGADDLDGGAGDDTITYDADDSTIAGGDDTDTLVVNVGATIDLSASGDQAPDATVVVTGFENVDASGARKSVVLGRRVGGGGLGGG